MKFYSETNFLGKTTSQTPTGSIPSVVCTTGFLQQELSTLPNSYLETGIIGAAAGTEAWYPAGMPSSNLSTLALTVDRLYAIPIRISKAVTLDRLAFNITAQKNGNSYVGVYSDLNYYPNTRLYTSSIIVTNANGVKNSSAVISLSLTPGIYWFALHASGNPTISSFSIGGFPIFGYDATLTIPQVGLYKQTTFAALPATFPSDALPLTTSIPAIFARFAQAK